MKASVPHIRIRAEAGFSLLRDGLNLSFYVRRSHRTIAQSVIRALDVYLQAVGPGAIDRFFDSDGFAQPLDDAEWTRIRKELLEKPWSIVRLLDQAGHDDRYGVEYFGKPVDDPKLLGDPFGTGEPHALCALGFWLPTEFLEEHGAERVRELALALADPLPWCFGQVGFAFKGWTNLIGVTRMIRARCFRYPGMDNPDLSQLSWKLGTRVRGPSWMTFLGQPVLGELGGAEGLRARLSSPGTTVQALGGERAVVTLGAAPDAGDVEQGNTLPAYRELARVLEPWLFQDARDFGSDFPPEDLRRWERRFLD